MTTSSLPDPLALYPAWRVTWLARRAERARRRGDAAVENLATSVNVPAERLLLLADAWREGGRSGIDALGPAPPFPEEAQLRVAREALEAWRCRQPAPHVMRWDLWRNRATLWHGDDAVAHLRLTAGGRWHLYRKLTSGEWWPVVVNGRRQGQGVGDCLAVLPFAPADERRLLERENPDRRPDGVG